MAKTKKVNIEIKDRKIDKLELERIIAKREAVLVIQVLKNKLKHMKRKR